MTTKFYAEPNPSLTAERNFRIRFLGVGVGGADKKWKGNFWFWFAATSYIISYHCDILYQYDILWIMINESAKLGLNLKRIRTKKGISQGDIARELEVGRGFISTIESGKTNPTLATIAKLAKAVGVSINELLK
mgnify:CR=1 FL=1